MGRREEITVEALLTKLQAGGGELHLDDPEPGMRAAYRRAINRAITSDAVPRGFGLRHTGRDRGDLHIRLVRKDEAPLPAPKVLVPESLAAAPAVLRALEASRQPGFSPAGWDRGLRLLAGIAEEADRRGYGFSARAEECLVFELQIGEEVAAFQLVEELERRAVADDAAAQAARYDWQRVPTHPVKVPSGRLVIQTPERYGAQHWRDRDRWRLDDKLAAVLAVAEQRCQQAADARSAARQRADELRQIWEAALPRAHACHLEAVNLARLDEQVANWRRARDYRAYAADLRTHLDGSTLGEDDSRAAAAWLGFIDRQAEALDPLLDPRSLRVVEPESPAAADLDRYMPKGMTVRRPPD